MARRISRPPRIGKTWRGMTPPSLSARPYQHAEAFCLMKYQCEKCKRIEVLWNSRDGVTPFTIKCRFDGCDGFAVHIDWQNDQRIPDYVPSPGQRVFIDMPESLKAPLARWRIAAFEGTEFEVKSAEEREVRTRQLTESFREGEPWIITWHI